ncbi:MAG: DUF2520 domain-containing protein [Acidobacteriota bacterium]|jgi:predicted short-subunit dehydrogenase-like oxidoreductase (DUF2520 family)
MNREFVLYGCGRAGLATALALKEAGWTLCGCASRSRASARKGASILKCGMVGFPEHLPAGAPLMLGVAESALPKVDAALAAGDGHLGGRVVFHMSGSASSNVLQRIQEAGGWTGSLHPLMAIPAPLAGARRLKKAWFALEGDPRALEILRAMADDISGKGFILPAAGKVLYHAAAVAASNHLAALLEDSRAMLAAAGTEAEAFQAFRALAESSVADVFDLGPLQALTGPVERGDVETVRAHLDALSGHPGLVDRYKSLSRGALEMARRRHSGRRAVYAELEKLLS